MTKTHDQVILWLEDASDSLLQAQEWLEQHRYWDATGADQRHPEDKIIDPDLIRIRRLVLEVREVVAARK